MYFYWPEPIDSPRPYRGMASTVSRARMRQELERAPFGWRYVRIPDRAKYMLVPIWFAWMLRLWAERYWWTYGVLAHTGMYCVREDGGYWFDGWFTWRTWESFDHMRTTAIRVKEARIPYVAGGPCINRWERIARWLERRVKDWNERMPHVGIGDVR